MEDRVFIGLGSNLGDREGNLRRAISGLRYRTGAIVAESPVYVTEPWGFEAEQDFLNQVVELRTPLEPTALMKELLDIERELGRVREEDGKYHSRPIDLDILFYGDKVVDLSHLKIPHPMIEHRDFVLRPMADIAPGFIHPSDGHTIEELLHNLSGESKLRVLE